MGGVSMFGSVAPISSFNVQQTFPTEEVRTRIKGAGCLRLVRLRKYNIW